MQDSVKLSCCDRTLSHWKKLGSFWWIQTVHDSGLDLLAESSFTFTHQLLPLQGFQACGSDPWFGTGDNTSTPVKETSHSVHITSDDHISYSGLLVLLSQCHYRDLPVDPAARHTSAHHRPSHLSQYRWRSLWNRKQRLKFITRTPKQRFPYIGSICATHPGELRPSQVAKIQSIKMRN